MDNKKKVKGLDYGLLYLFIIAPYLKNDNTLICDFSNIGEIPILNRTFKFGSLSIQNFYKKFFVEIENLKTKLGKLIKKIEEPEIIEEEDRNNLIRFFLNRKNVIENNDEKLFETYQYIIGDDHYMFIFVETKNIIESMFVKNMKSTLEMISNLKENNIDSLPYYIKKLCLSLNFYFDLQN